MYTYSGFTSLYSRNQHHIVKQLYSNFLKKDIKSAWNDLYIDSTPNKTPKGDKLRLQHTCLEVQRTRTSPASSEAVVTETGRC